MFELVEPIGTITFSTVPDEAFMALGMRNYWDGYFAGRAAPLGLAPAEVVHAVFYNFADGEVARHIPWVWGKITPQEAIAVRERGSATALRQRIGELADSSGLLRVADLATRAAVSAPTEGRVLYAGLRALDVPAEPVARLWHAATLLREHRGDGHNIALVAHGIGGTEAHVLLALSLGMRAQEFGRIHHLPKAQLAAVVDGLRRRGLVDAAAGSPTPAARSRSGSRPSPTSWRRRRTTSSARTSSTSWSQAWSRSPPRYPAAASDSSAIAVSSGIRREFSSAATSQRSYCHTMENSCRKLRCAGASSSPGIIMRMRWWRTNVRRDTQTTNTHHRSNEASRRSGSVVHFGDEAPIRSDFHSGTTGRRQARLGAGQAWSRHSSAIHAFDTSRSESSAPGQRVAGAVDPWCRSQRNGAVPRRADGERTRALRFSKRSTSRAIPLGGPWPWWLRRPYDGSENRP
nr:hypothetical protein [Fodinicola feengrottensis]